MTFNGNDLLTAIALLLIFEGLMPFLSPSRLKQAYRELLELPDKTLRTIGLIGVIAGILLLFLTD